MKYMIEYEIRTAGLTHEQNFANRQALLTAFGKWAPEDGLTVHAFVANLQDGGYVLVEAADAEVVLSFVSKYFYWNDVEVVPVVDVERSVAVSSESLEWARSATGG